MDGRNYDGVLNGIKVYYENMSAKKAKKIGIKMALSKILSGQKVDVIFVDENNTESPWKKKLREFLNGGILIEGSRV